MSQAQKTIYLVANWKSNKTLTQAREWFEAMKGVKTPEQVKQIVCLPYPFGPELARLEGDGSHFDFGLQDVSPFPFGAYTGAVAADMVSEWARYVIVGHSERRRYFHETDQEVANKVSMALEANMTPIVCIDEPYLESQLQALETGHKDKILVAYEPLSAIGSGHPDTPKHAQSVAERVQAVLRNEAPVLYGGSVTADNLKPFIEQPAIAGALVGGASLKTETWVRLIEAFYP